MSKEVNEVVEEKIVQHIVKQDDSQYIRSGYVWSTQYGKERYEEQRTIKMPEGTTIDGMYVYQLLTNADLSHMVIFNAYNQGKMDEDEFIELMTATKEVLQKAIPYIKLEKENKSEIYRDLATMYKRLKEELEENDII